MVELARVVAQYALACWAFFLSLADPELFTATIMGSLLIGFIPCKLWLVFDTLETYPPPAA